MWTFNGIWEKVLAEAQGDAEAVGDIEWTVSIDSTVARAHQHSAGARKKGAVNPLVLPRSKSMVKRSAGPEGVDLARSRRTTTKRDVDLARGPARLAVALHLTLDQDGADLLAAPYGLELPSSPPASVLTGPRVGVSGAGDDAAMYPWRFWIAGDPTVLAYRPGRIRRPVA